MAINGNNIMVYTYNGTSWDAVAATRSDEIQVDGEPIEIASSDVNDADWKRHIIGRKEWSLNLSWLVSDVADIRKVLLVGTRIKVHIGARGGYSDTNDGLTGYALIQRAKVTNTRGALSNGTFQFIGDGALS